MSQAAHIPHLRLHLGAQHGGDEGSTYNQTENWDVEKLRVEQKTIYEDRCKTGNGENCVSLYDTIFDTISTFSKSIQHRQCRKVKEISQKPSFAKNLKNLLNLKKPNPKKLKLLGKVLRKMMTKLKRRRLLMTSLAMTELLALCQMMIQALFQVMPLLTVMTGTLEMIKLYHLEGGK